MFTDESVLEEELSRPGPGLAEELAGLSGDVVVLGAGGKMGPTLSLMARRALDNAGQGDRRIRAVSRWSDATVRGQLDSVGVETVAADLLTGASYPALPEAGLVVYLVGTKFGTSGAQERLWQTNAVVPGWVAERYEGARIVALSTGNVYPMVPVDSGGSREGDHLGPVGEYAMSCLGRERVLSYAARERGTSVAIVRLNYAVEPRYGVVADVFRAVRAGESVDVTTGHVNVVWARYANEVVLRCLSRAAPEPFVLNLTGPETVAIRDLARRAGDLLEVEPRIEGKESDTALLNDASRCHELFGPPEVGVDALVRWQADWMARGGRVWSKPTKFQVRDGAF